MFILSGKNLLLAALAAGLSCLAQAQAANNVANTAADDVANTAANHVINEPSHGAAAPLVNQAADPFALPAKKEGATKDKAAASLLAPPAPGYPLERALTGRTALTFRDDKCGQPEGRKGDFISAALRTHF